MDGWMDGVKIMSVSTGRSQGKNSISAGFKTAFGNLTNEL